MVLDQLIRNKILELVQQRPRTVNEIALELGTSWKTADRYLDALKEKDGSVSSHTFRQGTRGALKVAYWNRIEPVQSETQDLLFKRLEVGKRKEDFSPLDIFQFAAPDQKSMNLFEGDVAESELVFERQLKELASAKNQACVFSGNLSWVNSESNGEKAIQVIEHLLDRKVDLKIICRVEIPSIRNIEQMVALERRMHSKPVEIRHLEQPLRGFVIDEKRVLLKESKNPQNYKQGELEKKLLVFYEYSDPEWVAWTQKVFWHCWQHSFDAKKRLESLQKPFF